MQVIRNTWRKSDLGSKLAFSNFLLVAAALLICVAAIVYGVSRMVEARAITELTGKTNMLLELIEGSDKDLRIRTASLVKAFQSKLKGKIELTEATVQIGDKATPMFKLDGKTVNLDFALVDQFTEATSAVATVFAKTGDDFVRITTSLKNDKGERAVGTLLDRSHPGYKAVVDGGSYTGLAALFGRPYMTQYDAIRDSQGKVIGVSFVGLDISDFVNSLKATIAKIKIGETGYFYVLDTRPGDNYGKLIIHPASEGQNIIGFKDSSGREFIKEILDQKKGTIRYPWINKDLGENSPREKVVAFAYLKSWNWVIAGGTYVDELTAELHSLRNWIALAGLIIVVLISAVWLVLIRRIVIRPMGEVSAAAEKIAQGDMSSDLKTDRLDEIGRLVHSMSKMQSVLTQFQSGLSEMSAKHSAGQLDHVILTQSLPGAYGDIAKATNDMVQSHTANRWTRCRPSCSKRRLRPPSTCVSETRSTVCRPM